MTAATEFSTLMRHIAGPRSFGETVTVGIYRAGRKLGLSRRQALALWYGERRSIPSDLMDRARALAAEPVAVEARNEHARLLERIARLEAALAVSDPEFHSPAIDALSRMGGKADRSVD
jgi:hypothetical protein